MHNDASNDWVLKIREARVKDSGMYECQVSTQPVRSFFVHLLVGGNHLIIINLLPIYKLCDKFLGSLHEVSQFFQGLNSLAHGLSRVHSQTTFN